ncbi:hypothetical protein [Patulibacter minatonensis]|uniref:hypothetical protein n=1 Tax=Patulibacter minatonensis TaxID=298163 RepID=UPI0004B8DEBD|nr:hypothetical protein [Patulibacter minatonensis]
MPKVELKGRLVEIDGVWLKGGTVVDVDQKVADRLVSLDAAEKIDGRRKTTSDTE